MSALQLWLQNHRRNLSQDAIDEALMEYIEHIEKQRDEFMASERNLSDAYIRLREKLSAFDTPTAPTAEQVYAHTEAKLDRLLEQRDELLAAIDVIIPALESRANGDSYLSSDQFNAVRKCREIKSDVKGGAA